MGKLTNYQINALQDEILEEIEKNNKKLIEDYKKKNPNEYINSAIYKKYLELVKVEKEYKTLRENITTVNYNCTYNDLTETDLQIKEREYIYNKLNIPEYISYDIMNKIHRMIILCFIDSMSVRVIKTNILKEFGISLNP